MQRNPEAFTHTQFDLAIVGGGINGAAIAREAALRGLKVALVEARDFSSGTSSRSSKLIHGGLRYLEQFDFRLVREARRERRLLMQLAPHLARPVPFLLPIYRGDPYSPFKVRLGLTIYDLLGNLGRGDRHRMLNASEAIRLMPTLRAEGLRGAAVYHDSKTDDARLTMENILDAAAHGAVVANYVEVRAFQRSAPRGTGKAEVVAAEVEDRLSGKRYELAARLWINAAGPWVDRVRALVSGFDGSRTIRLTKGTHLIVPPVTGSCALLAAIVPDDRVFLIVPWLGLALLGTTDTDFDGDPAGVQPDPSETAYLLRAANRVLSEELRPEQVLGSFAGLRALAMEPGSSPSANTREHRFHEDPWASNFVSVCGGKLTTARALAEQIVDQLAPRLDASVPSKAPKLRSDRVPLPGGHTGPFDAFVRSASEQAVQEFRLPPVVGERIVGTYGSRWRSVLAAIHQDPSLAEPLPGSPTLLAGEVDFAIREEMAVNLEDFLLRRSGLNWTACALREPAPAIADLFAVRLAWSAERRAAALESFARCACMGTHD